MRLNDTIAAISSAVGPAARMIVRVSGPNCVDLLRDLCREDFQPPQARPMTLHLCGSKAPIWGFTFAAGKSYTGEDLVEFHIPGNPLLARLLLDQLLLRGARPAEPGEFTARAFFNGRMDLSQAEGVAAVVAAANQNELDAGRRLMAGELSRRLRPLMDNIAQTLALIEAEIDFSDQDVRFLSADESAKRIAQVQADLDSLLKQSTRLARLAYEPRILLAGRPNAGKSTLLNALSRSSRAVVSPIAGTTRDALSAQVILPRGAVVLIDVAGLEEADGPSADPIESHMRRRALDELQKADAVVLVRDSTDPRPPLLLPRAPDLTVLTKIDLIDVGWASPTISAEGGQCPPYTSMASFDLRVSAVTGDGIEHLRTALDTLAFGHSGSAAELALTSRHARAIEAARDSLHQAALVPAAELLAAELRTALDHLGEVLGDISPDDILGRVFSTFCIGK
ncbi:MAG: tRNA modification GTPase [Tepidisphaeraceae bacterium]